jgi:hypothetical protein
MANGFYDVEGDIKFAEQKIEESRKIKEQRAKEQEKFAKRLATVDTIVRGGEFLINQRANELDTQQAWKKASYETMLGRAENIRNEELLRQKTGISQEDYLTNSIYNTLLQTAQEDNPNLDFDAARSVFKVEARNLAKLRLPDYQKLVNVSMEFPKFENFDKEYEKVSEIPRSIFGWLSSGVKNIARAETPETISYKEQKAKDALYGTPMYSKFTELGESIKNYDIISNNTIDVQAIIDKAKEQDLVKGKVIDSLSKVEQRTIPTGRGTQRVDTILTITRKTENGEIKSESQVLNSSSHSTADNFIKLADIDNLVNTVKPEHRDNVRKILNSDPAGATLATYELAQNYINANPTILNINWADEKNIAESFQDWYTSQIRFLEHPTAKDKQGIPIIMSIETPAGSGEWKIRDEYKDVAKQLGFDEPSALQFYRELGTAANLSERTFKNEEEFITTKTLEDKGYQDVQKLLKTSDTQQAWSNYLIGDDPELWNMYGNVIDKAVADGKTIADLGIIPMEMIFPDLGLKGNYSVQFDTTSNRLLIKK